MPSLKVSYKNPEYSEILDAFVERFGWKAGSGLTKAQFVEKCLRDFIETTWADRELKSSVDSHVAAEKTRLKTKVENARTNE